MRKYMIGLAVGLAVVALMAQSVDAAALTAARDTPARSGSKVSLTVASNVIIYAGSLVCVNSAGKAVPAADTASYAVVGRASKTTDNRTAVYVATTAIDVERGVFRWATNDLIVAADIGKLVYVTDDQTVNVTGGGQNIIAGTIVDVETGVGVWVDTAKIGPSGAATPSSLAVSGAATVGTTLGVGGVSTLGKIMATNAANVALTLGVIGNTTIGGKLYVTNTIETLSTVSAVAGSCYTQTITGTVDVPRTNVYNSSGFLISHTP